MSGPLKIGTQAQATLVFGSEIFACIKPTTLKSKPNPAQCGPDQELHCLTGGQTIKANIKRL